MKTEIYCVTTPAKIQTEEPENGHIFGVVGGNTYLYRREDPRATLSFKLQDGVGLHRTLVVKFPPTLGESTSDITVTEPDFNVGDTVKIYSENLLNGFIRGFVSAQNEITLRYHNVSKEAYAPGVTEIILVLKNP